MESTHPSLIARARVGDEPAWTRIAEIYGPFVAYWLKKWGVTEGAEDLPQEVLVRAWRGLAAGDHPQCRA